MTMAEYDYKITFVPGSKLKYVDCLSHAYDHTSQIAVSDDSSFSAREVQLNDLFIAPYIRYLEDNVLPSHYPTAQRLWTDVHKFSMKMAVYALLVW